MRRFRRWSSSSATTSREARRDRTGFCSAAGAAAAHRAAGRTGIGLRPHCRDRAYARAWQSQPGRPAGRNAGSRNCRSRTTARSPARRHRQTLKHARFSSSRSNSSTTRRCSNRPRGSLLKAWMRATPGARRSTRRSRTLKRPAMTISVTASATCATCARACWQSWPASSSCRCNCRRMQSCSPTTSHLRASSRPTGSRSRRSSCATAQPLPTLHCLRVHGAYRWSWASATRRSPTAHWRSSTAPRARWSCRPTQRNSRPMRCAARAPTTSASAMLKPRRGLR